MSMEKEKSLLVEELTKMIGDADTAQQLVDSTTGLVDVFADSLTKLIGDTLIQLKEAIEKSGFNVKSINSNDKDRAIGKIGICCIDDMVCILLAETATAATLTDSNLPSFVKHACEHYEKAAVSNALMGVLLSKKMGSEFSKPPAAEPSRKDLS
jgi:hypothetical protein